LDNLILSKINELTQEIHRLSGIISEYTNLGHYYIEKNNMEQGVQEFNQAQYISNHYAEAYYRRGKLYFEMKKYNKSIADFTATIKIGVNSPDALFARGLAYYNKSELDQAVLDWQELIRLYPGHNQSIKNLLAIKKGEVIENNKLSIRTIVLLMCGKNKLSHKAKVKDLYTSSRFQKSIEYAKTLTDYSHIFVLSAEHKLLNLDKKIYPYDKSIYEMTKQEKVKWAENVLNLLNSVSNTNEDKYIFLTNNDYNECLLSNLINYELPLFDIPEEKHLNFFSEKLSDIEISK